MVPRRKGTYKVQRSLNNSNHVSPPPSRSFLQIRTQGNRSTVCYKFNLQPLRTLFTWNAQGTCKYPTFTRAVQSVKFQNISVLGVMFVFTNIHNSISTVVIGVSVRVDGGPNTSSLDQTYSSRSPPFSGIDVSCHLKHIVSYIYLRIIRQSLKVRKQTNEKSKARVLSRGSAEQLPTCVTKQLQY